MTEKHTKGRLTLHKFGRITAGPFHKFTNGEAQEQLASVTGMSQSSADPDAEREANARRIVACWNACDGMSTETLEGALGGLLMHGGFVSLWSDYCDKKAEAQDLRAQVDQLLAALQACVQRLSLSQPLGGQAHDAAKQLLREHALLRAQAEASTPAPAPGKLPGNATN